MSTDGGRPGSPLLSVVVPAYDVEAYLDECLASLAAQTLRDLEVVVVDDGSPDRSAEIARRWVDRDPRFRLVRQDNHGLGHARNTGARHARGRYLAFVDSDDVVPRYAYDLMVSTIERSGSDFVTGNVLRFSSAGEKQSGLHEEAFAQDAVGTHVTRRRSLMSDRLAPNKVFRRSFWDEHGLAFPEGVLYEDIPVTLPAHFLARAVDVLRRPVYLWRVREGESRSITQDRTHLKGLEDRFAAIRSVKRFLREREARGEPAGAEAVRWFDDVALRSDVKIFLNAFAHAGEDFRRRFFELAEEYLDDVDPSVVDALPAAERLQYALVRRRLGDELVLANQLGRFGRHSLVPERIGGRYLLRHPLRERDDLDLPDGLFDVTDELRLRTRVLDVRWLRGRRSPVLRVEGWAYVDGVPTPDVDDLEITARAVARGAALSVPLEVRRRVDPSVVVSTRHERLDQSGGGFSVDLPVAALVRQGRGRRTSWSVELEVAAGGLVRTGRLGRPAAGRANRPAGVDLPGGGLPHVHLRPRPALERRQTVRVQPRYVAGALSVVVEPLEARVDDVRVEGRGDGPGAAGGRVLVVAGRWHGAVPDGDVRLRVVRRLGVDAFDHPVERDGRRFTARVPLDPVVAVLRLDPDETDDGRADPLARQEYDADGVDWDFELVLPGEDGETETVQLDVAHDLVELLVEVGEREVAVNRTRNSHLTLRARHPRPVVDDVRLTGDGHPGDGSVLRLAGRFSVPDGAEAHLLVVPRDGQAVRRVPMRLDGRSAGRDEVPGFRVDVDLAALPVPLTAGAYDLDAEVTAGERRWTVGVKLAHDLLARLPARATIGDATVELLDSAYDNAFLRVSSPLPVEERSALAQHRLREAYRAARERPLDRRLVLVDGTGGEIGSSPAAVLAACRLPAGTTVLWTRPDDVAVPPPAPEGAEPVRRGSARWHDALAVAAVVVVHDRAPEWFVPRDGQLVLDTGSGAPLETRADEVAVHPRGRLVPPPRSGGWTHALTPGAWARAAVRSVAGEEAGLLDAGRPRVATVLARAADAEARAAAAERLRRRLGLHGTAPLVLHAPTWRPGDLDGPGRPWLSPELDTGALAAAVRAARGEDAVVLLHRPHGVLPGERSRPDGRTVVDVTGLPDPVGLLLAADVLVTDASPLVADATAAGVPVVLWGPHLDEAWAEAAERGIDLAATPPGRVARDAGALRDALAAPADAATVEAFRSRWAALDDADAPRRAAALVEQHLGG